MTVFEDFPQGRVVETGSITVTEAHIVAWANLTGDWNCLHMDEVWARERGPFGARVAHGPFVFGLAVGLMERTGAFGDAVLAWLGADALRANAPTFLGDTLRVRATVLEARPSRSDPSRGIVTLRYEVLKNDGEEVLSCRFVLMMRAAAA